MIWVSRKSILKIAPSAILPEWLRGRTRNALAKAAKVRILRIAILPFQRHLWGLSRAVILHTTPVIGILAEKGTGSQSQASHQL